MITLKIFGDESADESAERVFAVSAVIGTEDDWSLTVPEWVRLTGGFEFHANEFETEFVNDTDRTKHPARLEQYKALVQLLCRSPLAGFCVSLDIQAFKEHFHDLDIGYYKCFSDILAILAPLARRWNEQVAANPDEYVKAELTFDRRQGQGTILTLYDTFNEMPEWRESDLFNSKMSFDTRANPRVQIADLIAREGMKEHDRLITGVPRKQRRAMAALLESGRYRFPRTDRERVIDWKAEQPEMEAREGFPDGYVKWLIDTGRVQNGKPVDNLRNKVMYMAWRDNQAAILEKKKGDSS